jgi:hypothetical protein
MFNFDIFDHYWKLMRSIRSYGKWLTLNTRHGFVEDFMTWIFKLLIHSQILVLIGVFLFLGLGSFFFIFVEMFQQSKNTQRKFSSIFGRYFIFMNMPFRFKKIYLTPIV